MKAIGTKIASNTKVVATTALETWLIAFMAASLAFIFSSCIKASVRSTTTMASSTTRPIASTKPNKVKMFKLNPKVFIMANVAKIDTGIAIDGTKVARQSCKNT